jgi:hypothetical protein
VLSAPRCFKWIAFSRWLFATTAGSRVCTLDFFTTKDTKSTKGLENEALDPILKPSDIEVCQETDLHPRQFHVGQQLSLVNALDLLHTLQL